MGKTIVVTDVKLIQLDEDVLAVAGRIPDYPSVGVLMREESTDPSWPGQHRDITEYIVTRSYRNEHGETVRIGISQRVQNVLGIPFDSFNQMMEESENLRKANREAQSRLVECEERIGRIFAEVSNAGFWNRVRYALTGHSFHLFHD